MVKKVLLIILLVVFVIVGFVVFENYSKNINLESAQVVTSFYPLYFFTSYIAGDKIKVSNIIPFSAEPHDYGLTSSDIVQIHKSKLLILNGIIEPWADKVKEITGNDTKIVLGDKNTLSTDPHIWLSPLLAKDEAKNILAGLIDIDPKNSFYYKQNEQKLGKELDKLDGLYKTDLQNCETRTFVTSHAAFGYLAAQYNLNQIAISGISPDAEPSFSKLAEITNLVKKLNIKYVFFESLVSPKLSQTVANETGAQIRVLDPIEGIQKSDLGKGANYLTLMQNNLQNLREALQCK